MAYRRSFGLVASCLSILSGCGGAPAPMPLRQSLTELPNGTAEMPAVTKEASKAAETNTIANACAPRRGSTLHAVSAGRGERVVLAKQDQTTLAFVANEDDGAIHAIDIDKGNEIGVTQLPGSPSALVLLADGRIVVTLRDRNEMLVMEASDDANSKFDMRCRIPVASEPVGLASVNDNGAERVVVAAGYGHALGIIDTKNFNIERWVDLPRDPRAVVIENGRAYVSHMVSAKLSSVDLNSGNVDKIDILSNSRLRSLRSKDEGDIVFGNQAFSLAKNERGRLFVPMVTVDPGEPKITSAYGSAEAPIKPFVGVVDLVANKQLDLAIPRTSPNQLECMLPRASAAIGDRLFVTCLGTDELVEFDGRSNQAAEFMRRRIQLPRGPIGLAIEGSKAVVMSQFDRVVSIVHLDNENSIPATIALSRPEGTIGEVFERGRAIFHDSFDVRISKDGRACASCHPDGREDGFTWSTPDGPRQTVSLAGRLPNAAPYGWFGEHRDLQNHLKHTVSRLGGQGFGTQKDEADLNALVTYISKMKAPVAVRHDESSELVAKGHALFHSVEQGCGDCHAEGGTDRVRHDVGTGNVIEARLSFDTPSLMAIAGSAPYYHDGRYKSLDDLLSKADDKMGHAKHLKTDERAAMVAYMESLSPAISTEMPERKFVRHNGTVAVPSVTNSPMERLALRQSPPRKPMDLVDLDLEALPVVSVRAPVKYDEKNPEPQGGDVESILVWNGECAAVPYHSAAFLRIDWQSTGMSRSLERCVYRPYDDGVRVWRDMRAQTVDPLPDGRLHVEQRDGFFRVNSHEFRETAMLAADAVPIGNGLAFAFRTICKSCAEGQQEKLHVITPPSSFWGDELFTWHVLQLDKGTVDGFSAEYNLPNLGHWKKATKVDVESGSTIGSPRNVVLRIGTSRTFSEDKPSVVVGRSYCIEQDFGCK